MKNIMDLNQAEVAVTTQHLIDTRQEKDSLLYYPGISGNYFEPGIPRFEIFDDNYD